MAQERESAMSQELRSLWLQAERLGATSDLARQVTHSINSPLTALLCAVSLAIEDARTPQPELQELLELTERVGEVLRGTLELYREGQLKRTPENAALLADALQQAIGARARECRVEVRVSVERDLPTLEVDRPLLLAALENVAANALDWSHPDGRLWIDVRLDETQELVEFELRDDGPGVPEENQSRIFETFFTTRQEGAGLGLPIALGAIRGHGGRIEVRNHPDGGAVFTLSLPPGGRD
jgi:two-component system sensor kinase FixL